MPPAVPPPPRIMAFPPSPPSSSSSVVPPRPPVVEGRFESPLLLPVFFRVAADRQRLRHGNGRQVTHLAGIRRPERHVRLGVIKWFSVAPVTTGGVVVTGDARLGDDVVMRRWRARGAARRHGNGDILDVSVVDERELRDTGFILN